MDEQVVELTVNGITMVVRVEPRTTLVDALRDQCGLTGTHAACEHGVCGACTVLFDGQAVRSCLLFAVQSPGHEVVTVEGLTPSDGGLSPLQEALRRHHGLQCGFCTPGFVVSLTAFLAGTKSPTDEEILDACSGNLCRCTGYRGIVRAVRDVSRGLVE